MSGKLVSRLAYNSFITRYMDYLSIPVVWVMTIEDNVNACFKSERAQIYILVDSMVLKAL